MSERLPSHEDDQPLFFLYDDMLKLSIDTRQDELQKLEEYAETVDPNASIHIKRYILVRRAQIVATVTQQPE